MLVILAVGKLARFISVSQLNLDNRVTRLSNPVNKLVKAGESSCKMTGNVCTQMTNMPSHSHPMFRNDSLANAICSRTADGAGPPGALRDATEVAKSNT